MKLDDRHLKATLFSPICSKCAHFNPSSILLGDKPTCTAFGDKGIPRAIWSGANDHTQPFKGDSGIQFESLGKVS